MNDYKNYLDEEEKKLKKDAEKRKEGYALQEGHESRPFWVTKKGEIILEAFNPLYSQAYEFVIAIAQPVSRTEFIHQYLITMTSLLGASAYNLSAEGIVKHLKLFSKNVLPDIVANRVRLFMRRYGKVKLIIRNQRYFIESTEQKVLHQLLSHPDIRAARKGGTSGGRLIQTMERRREANFGTGNNNNEFQSARKEAIMDMMKRGNKNNTGTMINTYDAASEARKEQELRDKLEDNNNDSRMLAEQFAMDKVYSFEIDQKRVNSVRRGAYKLDAQGGYPILKEYDYLNDRGTKSLNALPRVQFKPREYQSRALGKMFGNKRAKSGIIVLPCGAGKTFVGISACITVNKSCLCLVINDVAVEQWKKEFLRFSTLEEKQIVRLTSRSQDQFNEKVPCVVITTYSMMGMKDTRRAAESKKVMDRIASIDWGLLLLDEVHVAPANTFRNVLARVRAHAILGLTATLVREDSKIDDLNFLIGPKLYEANWMDLTNENFLARVMCKEVWCPMTKEFFSEYLKLQDYREGKIARTKKNSRRQPARLQQRLYCLNPNKMLICHYLVQQHRAKGHKILIFADDIKTLKYYNQILGYPMIFGGSSQEERLRCINTFKLSSTSEVLLISKIGDTSIDLPECNVVMQISSHGGSRRQEAQRLGRVLRPKEGQEDSDNTEPNAFFYALISTGTKEVYHNRNRQRYLNDQGYPYTIQEGSLFLYDKEFAKVDRILSRTGDSGGITSKEKQLALMAKLLEVEVDDEDKEEELASSDEDEDRYGSFGIDLTTTNGESNSNTNNTTTTNSGSSNKLGVSLLARARRGTGSISKISDGSGMSYHEQQRK